MKILIALLFTVNLFGSVSPDYITTNYYDPSVVIAFDAWKGETLSIKIMSQNAEVLYNNRVNTDLSDGIKYNLKQLGDGKYTILLESNSKLVEEKVILINGKMVEKDAIVYFKPVININASKAEVSFLSYNGKVDVSIVNNGKVVFADKVSNMKPFNKIYNLSALDKGNYSIKISNDRVSKTVEFKL